MAGRVLLSHPPDDAGSIRRRRTHQGRYVVDQRAMRGGLDGIGIAAGFEWPAMRQPIRCCCIERHTPERLRVGCRRQREVEVGGLFFQSLI